MKNGRDSWYEEENQVKVSKRQCNQNRVAAAHQITENKFLKKVEYHCWTSERK